MDSLLMLTKVVSLIAVAALTLIGVHMARRRGATVYDYEDLHTGLFFASLVLVLAVRSLTPWFVTPVVVGMAVFSQVRFNEANRSHKRKQQDRDDT